MHQLHTKSLCSKNKSNKTQNGIVESSLRILDLCRTPETDSTNPGKEPLIQNLKSELVKRPRRFSVAYQRRIQTFHLGRGAHEMRLNAKGTAPIPPPPHPILLCVYSEQNGDHFCWITYLTFS